MEAFEDRLNALMREFFSELISVWSEFAGVFKADWGLLFGLGIFLLLFWRIPILLKCALLFISTASLSVPLPLILDIYLPKWNLEAFNLPRDWSITFVLNALGVFVVLIIGFRLITKSKEWWKSKYILTSPVEREGLSDVRRLERFFPNTRWQYNPSRYFSNSSFFLGRGLGRRLAKVLDALFNKQHLAITGPTGSGKGVLLQSLMVQAIIKGQTTIYLDPNSDNITLRVLEQYAKRMNKPFYYIDLNGDEPQWNPWANQTNNEIEELCTAVFGLSDNFDIADVHRLADRDAAIAFAKVAANRRAKPFELIADLLATDSSLSTEAKKFMGDLAQLADMGVVNTKQGLDLSDAIQNRAIIYVRGATRNPRVLKLQRLFVLAVIHAAEKRRRHEIPGPPVFLVIDEYKYSVSPQSTEALATIRKSDVHMALATQSYTDLRNCPKDMDPDAVISSVIENAGIHINYKSNDVELAETIAKSTGSIPIDEEVRDLEINPIWAETSTGSRSLRKSERSRIDTNMIMNMPPGCAVIRGNVEPRIIHICPVSVNMKKPLPQPTLFVKQKSQVDEVTSLPEELINVT